MKGNWKEMGREVNRLDRIICMAAIYTFALLSYIQMIKLSLCITLQRGSAKQC